MGSNAGRAASIVARCGVSDPASVHSGRDCENKPTMELGINGGMTCWVI